MHNILQDRDSKGVRLLITNETLMNKKLSALFRAVRMVLLTINSVNLLTTRNCRRYPSSKNFLFSLLLPTG